MLDRDRVDEPVGRRGLRVADRIGVADPEHPNLARTRVVLLQHDLFRVRREVHAELVVVEEFADPVAVLAAIWFRDDRVPAQ